jgi:dolichol-phosphate mannosyltransferase
MVQIMSAPPGDARHLGAPVTLAAPELSVIVPTFKESGNVAPLIRKLDTALAGIAWEAIFVDDDSPDGTSSIAKSIARDDPRVRCIRRVNRRGLSGACIEGFLSSAAPYVAVIDGDMQHDETKLPRMLEILRAGEADLVAGTRYSGGGNADAFSKSRDMISRGATVVARRFTNVRASDPMSGFFMMRRDKFDPIAGSLTTQGFKILLDILITSGTGLRVAEIPYVFGARAHGESKLDSQVALDFLGLLLAKTTGGLVTARFLSFASVGAIGLLVHMAVLSAALAYIGFDFTSAQAIATLVAMSGNFALNNRLTYRDRRLSGMGFLSGLFKFYAISAIGAVANVGIASWVYTQDTVWWFAGVSGAVMGAVWNYSMATLVVWRVK